MTNSYAGDDDDNESYVTIGTPFDVPEENEVLPKATKIEDQIVTDNRGRRRFHGAFTGGFSAGYFNSVGSKEGWSPSTFVSSRSQKKKDDNIPRSKTTAEDYMDEEDFADHGIAPKKLKTVTGYDLSESDLDTKKKSFQRAVEAGDVHSAIPGGLPLDDLLGPGKLTVGVKLLKKMGWKPGQGVGEKVHMDSEIHDTTTANKKVYGCALPPTIQDTSSYDQSSAFLLAPKDIQPITFIRKDNLHGIGYSGIVLFSNTSITSTEVFRPSGNKKKGIRGQAFGTGVFEDEDENIYADDKLSAYDMTMGDENQDDMAGWSGAPKAEIYKGCLQGFIKSSIKLEVLELPSMIELPPHYVPRHILPDNQSDTQKGHSKLTSEDRSVLLGEAAKGLDDVSKWTLKWDQSSSSNNVDVDSANVGVKRINSAVDSKKSRFSRWDKDKDQLHSEQKESDKDQSAVSANEKALSTDDNKNTVFKPFSKYPEKQKRYEEFIEARNNNCKLTLNYDNTVTEWEREQELAEFSRAAVLYQPLVSAMADRFTRANFNDMEGNSLNNTNNDSNHKHEDKESADSKKSREVTRTVLSWHPDPLLCKRLNIANPYPKSRIKGVPGRGKKQPSFFSDVFTGNVKAIAPTEPVKNDGDSDEEDYFTRISKGKVKPLSTSKGMTGPLSVLNIKIDVVKGGGKEGGNSVDSCKINSVSSTSVKVMAGHDNTTAGLTEVNVDLESEENSKPSMDIFKAIFDDSESENSDVIEEKVKEENEEYSSASKEPELVSFKLDPSVRRPEPVSTEPTRPDVKNLSNTVSEKKNIATERTDISHTNYLPLSLLNVDKSDRVDLHPADNTNSKLSCVDQSILGRTAKRADGINCELGERVREKYVSKDSGNYRRSCRSDKYNGGCDCIDSDKNHKSEHYSKCAHVSKSKDSNDSAKYNSHNLNDDTEFKERCAPDDSAKYKQSCASDNGMETGKYHNNRFEDHIETWEQKRCDSVNHKKKKKEKKLKKYKKKEYESENVDSDSDENHKRKKRKKTKHKRRRSSTSASENEIIVPSNSVLIEKLKRLSQSSKRPSAADFM